jgi:tetratricopeptide (TPR) repeat protein
VEARERLDRVASLLVGAGAAAPSEPGLPAVRRELALLLLDLGDAPAALAEAEMAVRDAPDDADAQLARGRALLELGRAAEAVAALRSARSLAAARADIANALGRALHLAGDAGAAVAAFEEALRLDPSLVAARDNLALARGTADRAAASQRDARVAAIFPGLALRDATWARGGRRAAEIVEVAPDGAAALAGLRVGDLILRIDGAAVPSAAALDAALRQTSAGRTVRLDLVRGEAPFSVELSR